MPRTLVGLDIGSTGVRAAELVPGRRRSAVRRFASVPLDPGVVRAGTVVDGEALTQALRQLWSQGRFSSKEVVLGIASSSVLVRQLDLDWMPTEDFRKALRYQVQDVLPFSVDEANLDYHLLDELEVTAEDGTPRRVSRILLVAAAREVVDAFVAAAREGDFGALMAILDPDVVLRADFGPVSREVRGAEAVARQATGYSQIGLVMHPVLINGVAGMVSTRDGHPFSVGAVTVRGGRIVEMDILADPERLRRLDLAGRIEGDRR